MTGSGRAGPAGPILLTPRLSLVALTVDLARDALRAREQFARRLGAAVPAEWPLPDFAGILPVLASDLEAMPELARWTRLVVTRDRPTLVGEIGLKAPPSLEGTVDVGYSILPAHRGRGLATEATRAVVAWALAEPGVERVTAETLPGNLPSQRVLAASGLVEVDRSGGCVRWSVERS